MKFIVLKLSALNRKCLNGGSMETKIRKVLATKTAQEIRELAYGQLGEEVFELQTILEIRERLIHSLAEFYPLISEKQIASTTGGILGSKKMG